MKNEKHYSERLRELYTECFKHQPEQTETLPSAGSDRKYLRLTGKKQTVIGVYNTDKAENNTYIYFTGIFRKHDIAAPEILATSKDGTCYLVEDKGDVSLLQFLEEKGLTEAVKDAYRKSIDGLLKIQWIAGKSIDYRLSFSSQEFDNSTILSDLLYFKYYFADRSGVHYDKPGLLKELNQWADTLAATQPKTFMYRDFQGRNIMLDSKENPAFIDFQGGMKGLPQYDIASLLWQAKARLPFDFKTEMLNYYLSGLEKLPSVPRINEQLFRQAYLECVLLRMLQTLGAYGLRGLIEQRPHFLSSIAPALEQLAVFLDKFPALPAYPELSRLLRTLVSPKVRQRFVSIQAKKDDPLKVYLYSFSYKKGLPADGHGHGGGYVFDCRGILNPGRQDAYKELTGKDDAVIQYLEMHTRMPEFLKGVFATVDITVEDYLSRKFDSLSIAFGCTGGRHRSVYAAEATKKHLKDKYGIVAEVLHLEQEAPGTPRR